MKRRLLKSYVIGFLIIALLYGFAWFGAMHQDYPVIGGLAYVVAGIIGAPLMLLYGVDSDRQPPIIVAVAIYLAEAVIFALPVYLVLYSKYSKKNLT